MTSLLWTLIFLQIAMGAFDTLFHHEFTERLAWRKSQAKELKLHAIRNGFYGLIFAGFGWLEFHGLFAYGLLTLLAIELIITLMDFVEEDRSRLLPASERVAHTLMALNYGSILVLLVPVLLGWGKNPSALVGADYGPVSWALLASAIAVTLFGLRDWFASLRLAKMPTDDAGGLLAAGAKRKAVLITGGTGFVGSKLVAALASAGHDVTVLTRNMARAKELSAPVKLITDLDQLPDDTKLDAIVSLAGHPIASGLWTAKHRRKVMLSRLHMNRRLRKLVDRLEIKPEVFLNASAIGVYGIHQDQPVNESHVITADGSFSNRSCAAVEHEACKMQSLGVRTINLRIGLVLDLAGGPLGQMLVPFDLGAGGRLGSGQQWMSWISRDDLVRLIDHCIGDTTITGPVNATAPTPVQNKTYAKALGRAMHRPALIPLPALVLEKGLQDFAKELFLGSQNILPIAALQSGFVFVHPTIDMAFASMFGASNSGPVKQLNPAPVL